MVELDPIDLTQPAPVPRGQEEKEETFTFTRTEIINLFNGTIREMEKENGYK